MNVFARWELAAEACDGAQPALLLEGSWPSGMAVGNRRALDDDIDARHAWIDEEAIRLAETLAEATASPLARLNALTLRYYLVKLLRPIAWCEQFAEANDEASLRLHVEHGRDDDYVALFHALCSRHGWKLSAVGSAAAPQSAGNSPRNAWWRRLAARGDALFDRCRQSRGDRAGYAPRALLCGNPSLLDPVCEVLLSRGCRVAWLYDRFAWGTFRRWGRRGVRQFVCNSAQSNASPLSPELHGPRLHELTCREVDLTAPLQIWLTNLSMQRGRQQAGLWNAVAKHCADFRPTLLVLDEDATPLARAAALACRRMGAKSWVVQHGAPRVRFGFSPLLVDGVLAWGESSRSLMTSWGVPSEQIVAVGSPKMSSRPRPATAQSDGSPHVVILATVPPSDARPDAVEFHLTSRAHDDMLRRALAAAAKFDGARVTIKLHPRCRREAAFHDVVQEFSRLPVDVVARVGMHELLAKAACVMNCGSSAGIEAAWHGLPVIELLPEGGVDPWPAEQWGLFGSARTQGELDSLLARALAGACRRKPAVARQVFARIGRDAARAAVEAMFSPQVDETSLELLAASGGRS